MKRTTIFADESLLKSLLDIAQRERSSLASVIRRALEKFVGRRQEPAPYLPVRESHVAAEKT